MKPIEKNELYQHVSEFLKGKGIELKAGSYATGIQTGCSILADAINLSQKHRDASVIPALSVIEDRCVNQVATATSAGAPVQVGQVPIESIGVVVVLESLLRVRVPTLVMELECTLHDVEAHVVECDPSIKVECLVEPIWLVLD